MSYKLVITNVMLSTIAHILYRGSIIVSSIIFARNVNAELFAAYSYFQITVSMLSAYASIGMGISASKFFAESNASSTIQTPILSTIWIISVIGGCAISVIVLCVPDDWVNGGLLLPNWILSLGILSVSLCVVPNNGVLGLECYVEYVLVSIVSACCLILGISIASYFESLHIALVTFILSSFVQGAGSTIVIMRRIGFKWMFRQTFFGKNELHKVFSFVGPMIGVSLLSSSGAWLVGRIILWGPSGEYGFALYAIGFQWFALVLFVPGMVTRVLLPIFIRARLENSSNLCSNLLKQGLLLTIFSAIVVSVLGASISPFLIKLYGVNYDVNTWFIALFMIAAIPSAPANTLGNAIVAHDGQKIWLAITLIWFMCVVLVSSLFVNFGAVSGAISQCLSSLIMTLLSFIAAYKMRLLK